MQLRRVRHLIEYALFRMVGCVVEAMPVRLSVRIAEILAFVIHRLLPRKLTRYEVARTNIRTAFGDQYSEAEIDRMIYQMWVHLFRMVAEILQLPRKLRLYNCVDVIEFHRNDETIRALCSGRPVIVLSGHFGNWEMAVNTFGMYGFPLGVIARDLDNPYLHNWFARFRRQTGHQLISKKGGGFQMVELLDHRGGLAMLADQDAGSSGLFVDFFGKPASTFKSIALLALQYRALICVGYGRRLKDDFQQHRWVRYEIGCADIIDPLETETNDPIGEITTRYTQALEKVIRLAPEQYFWVHRRWKSVPGKRKRRRRKAAA